MLKLQTELEGQKAYFGHMQTTCKDLGYSLGGNWDYDRGQFDYILSRDGGETIYLRVPFNVVNGELDRADAMIEFQTPYVIKHVVNVGLDNDASSLISATVNQFQEPLDKDGYIRDKSRWEQAGEDVVNELLNCLHHS